LSWFWSCFSAEPLLAGVPTPKGFKSGGSWHLPLVATLVLLASAAAVTWAHNALLRDDRRGLRLGLGCAILLSLGFLGVQAYEHGHAPFAVPANLCGAMLFMWTGYHGTLVTVGLVVLIACLLLARRFSAKQPFGFELVVWSWHVVDTAWLVLFAGTLALIARANAGAAG
jgi:cytochrome c oxidase subunit 3